MVGSSDICVLGDSVLLGVVFDEAKGRYSLLRDGALTAFTRGLGMRVTNLSRMGQTSLDAKQLFTDAVNEGLCSTSVLIELGGNDCDLDWEEVARNPEGDHLPKVSIQAFKETLRSIISMAREKGIRPILATLPPLDPSKFFNWVARDAAAKENVLRFLGDIDRIYRWQELYNLELVRIASEEKVSVFGLREAFLEKKGYQGLICKDGIHPNSNGHMIMKEAILSYFSSKMIVATSNMLTA
jgi:acyl-CoA thioesterase-1